MKFLLIITLLIPVNLYSQDLSSLKINEVDSLLALSRQATIEINVDSSLEYAFKALAISEQKGYSAGKTRAYFYIAQALYCSGSYKKALEYLTLAQDEKHAAENFQILSEIYRVRGRIYGSMELNSAAIREFRKGLVYIDKIEIKANREYLKSLAYENLIVCYKKAGKADSVFHYIQKDRELLKNMDESFIYRSWMNLYSFLGEYQAQHGQYDSAAHFFNRSLELSEKYSFPYTSTIYLYWGNMEKDRGNADSALYFYFGALKNIEKTRLENELPQLYENVALVYAEKGIADSAKHYRAKAMATENRLAKEKIDAYEQALDIIVKEETAYKQGKNRRTIFIITGSFLFCFGVVLVFYLFRQRKNTELINEKEKEALQLKQKINESFDEITELAKNNDPAFLVRFQEIYPEFTNKLLDINPNLATSEIRFCALLTFNFTSKEIARFTFTSPKTIENKKTRIRKRLNIPLEKKTNLYLKELL